MNVLRAQEPATRLWLYAAVAAGLVGSSLMLTPEATAASDASPGAVPVGLSITIDDGVTETTSGSSLTYTATVTNRGTASVAGELVITVPSFATYSNVGGAGIDNADAAWKVNIAPGKSERRRVTAEVGRIPKGDVRVTTLATLYPSSDRSRILVRAADANGIEGVVDPAHSIGQRPAKGALAPTGLLVGGGSVLFASALIVSWVLITRRRKRRAN